MAKANTSFVNDGYWRARAGAEPAIRAEVLAEFNAQLAAAGRWQRFWLLRRVEREIARRLERAAARHALY